MSNFKPHAPPSPPSHGRNHSIVFARSRIHQFLHTDSQWRPLSLSCWLRHTRKPLRCIIFRAPHACTHMDAPCVSGRWQHTFCVWLGCRIVCNALVPARLDRDCIFWCATGGLCGPVCSFVTCHSGETAWASCVTGRLMRARNNTTPLRGHCCAPCSADLMRHSSAPCESCHPSSTAEHHETHPHQLWINL